MCFRVLVDLLNALTILVPPLLITKVSIATVAIRLHFEDENTNALEKGARPLPLQRRVRHFWTVGKDEGIIHE